ncbi:hypothetical protein DENSPDRAFT_781042 [Dentipellis sp. KUC8613]|nr:hypothetical protein DENSPDRAFT_781042 [Dentipellis sp. KUC8613]
MSSRTESPETYRRNSLLAKVPEDEALDDEDDEEALLAEKGLFIGSYRRYVLLYTIVPLTSFLLWLLIAFLPSLIWHTPSPTSPSQPRYFPTPLPELLTAISLWALSYLLSEPLYAFFSLFLPPTPAVLISTAVHVLLRNLLRLAALPILLLRHYMDWPHPTYHDPVFRRVWWLALGWSLAEVAVGVTQGYAQLALYRDVLVPEERVEDLLESWRRPVKPVPANGRARGQSLDASPPAQFLHPNLGSSSHAGSTHDSSLPRTTDGEVEGRPRVTMSRLPSEAELRLEVDKDVDELVLLKTREELEELYGIPVIYIPVFITCLLRIASVVLSLGFTLLLSAAYLSAPISLSPYRPHSLLAFFAPPVQLVAHIPLYDSNRAFYITFALVFLLHFFLSVLHTPVLLPRIGVHVVAYLGFLVGLGTVFAGLGLWDALS